MDNITLSEKEVEILKKSINHCIETCKEGGSESGCTDCDSLGAILEKLTM
jgi:hypothetical protein